MALPEIESQGILGCELCHNVADLLPLAKHVDLLGSFSSAGSFHKVEHEPGVRQAADDRIAPLRILNYLYF